MRNRAERRLRPGLRERVTALNGRIEWALALERRPSAPGPLSIDGRVAGGSAFRVGSAVVKDKDGRRNRYQIQAHLPLREAITQQRTIGEVLDVLVESKIPSRGRRTPG